LVLSFTPYLISVFAGNDSIICSATTQLNGVVNIATGGVWTTSGTGTFLPADSLLNASYQFSTADTSAGTVNLYLTSTGNGGCLGSSDTVTYSFADLITLNASVFDTTCAIPFPIPINVSVSTGSIIWSTLGDGTFDPSATAASSNYIPGATDLINGSVILIATSQNNGTCAAQTDTSLITFVPAPTADFTSTQVCANDSTQFTDASFAVDGIINWFWGFENGDTSIAQNPSYSFSLGGIYNVTLTVTSTNGCTDTTVASVTVSSDPLAGFTSTANCFVDSVVFSDTSFVNIGSISNWDWDFGDGNSDTIQNPINFYPGPGSYDVTLIVTSSDGCVDSIVIATSVNPNPFADFTYIINCVNQPIVFNDASSVSSGSIANWEWDFGNTLTSTTQNPNANFTDDISYDVELIVTSDSGCVDTVIQSIIPYSLPITDFDAIGLCLEDGTQFNDLSTVNGSSIVAWEWDFGNGNQTTEQSPEYFYSTSGTYAVTFITESAQGCVDTLQQAITVNPSPTAAFTMSPLIVELFENIVFTDQSTDAVTWDWNFGDGIGTDVSPNPEYSYLDTGLFVTELIIENQYGCPDTATGEIAVVMTPIVPAGFSPDGNGENDILYVLGGPYTSLDFKIYNNWGELIFTSRDQGNGWDGTRDGVDQPIGVYIFTLDAVRLDGTEYKQVHGDITLLR
jgi:gliding motility-associated-like protein